MIELDLMRGAIGEPRGTVKQPPTIRSRVDRAALMAVLGWCAFVGVGYVLVFNAMVASGISQHDAAPLHATFAPRVAVWVLVAIACASLGAVYGSRVARALSWRGLLVTSWGASIVWACSLAATRGAFRITSPLEHPGEYLAVLPRMGSVGGFLDRFVAEIGSFPTHVKGHPPGFVLIAWVVEQLGLGGTLPLALLCIAMGAAAIPAVLITVREVAGATAARRAAPFLVIAPFAISVATSADAFFAGVGAWAVAMVVLATGRRDRRGDILALGGGLLFGVTAFLSYGLVLLGVIPLVVAIQRRRARPVILACIGAIPVFVGFLLTGFWWIDGFLATRHQYFAGLASRRPYGVYLVANVASFAIILGPAIVPALLRLRDRRLWLVVGGALLAAVLADVSGMSKAEVERIWLPFAPFVLVTTAALGAGAATVDGGTRGMRSPMGWIALQAGFVIVLESLVRTGW